MSASYLASLSAFNEDLLVPPKSLQHVLHAGRWVLCQEGQFITGKVYAHMRAGTSAWGCAGCCDSAARLGQLGKSAEGAPVDESSQSES